MSGNASSVSYFKYQSIKQLNSSYSCHLSKSILSNGLEGLLYIDCFLCACLKVRDLVLRVAPLLGPLGGHGPVVKVHLVAQNNKRKVVRVPWTCLARLFLLTPIQM